ncbi:phage tail tape measure protein [Candidatus Pacearchaeota archaeon]|jgi:TP901 family phage tail tape measure protein|nr:phage tail tape measure protein [Candidatus Pacearchaeota archaeon]
MPSAEVGSAYATLGLDDSKLDSGLSGAKSKFSSAVDAMEGKAKSMGSAIGGALKTGLEVGAVALAGVATVGVKTFMDIESAAADAASKMDLSSIAQASGKSMEEAFTGVKEHVMALSDELGQLNTNAFDPTQIAQACANLAAGGFDVATASAKDLEPILSLATATTYDLDKSAGLAMSTMNQFGMSVDDLGRISDVYATAAGKSAASMTDFDYAMQQAGPVAKGVGMSFEELTARISKLADAGYSGEKSGTALRTAMMALTSPTKTQAETLEKLGISYADIDPRVHSFGETLDLLTAKGADIYDFGEIFGKEGAAIVYSSAQQSAGVKQLTADLENSKGAASSMAKMMLDSLKGSFDAAMGAASSLAYLIGGKLAPTLKSAFEWFSSTGAPAIRSFIEAVADGDWTKIGSMLTDAVKAGWAKLKDLGGQLLGWLKAVNWGALGTYILDGLKSVRDGMVSMGGQLLSALVSVDWGGVGTAIWEGIKATASFYIEYWKGIYDAAISIDWGAIGQSIYDAIAGAVSKLSDIGSEILGYFDSIDWGTVGFKIGQAIRDAIVALADIGQKIWDYLTSADWSGAGSSISEKIKAGLAKLKEFWTEFKSGISSVDFATAGKEIGDKIKAGLGQISDYAKSIYEKIKTGWDSWIASDGPKKLGESFAHSLVKGVVDLGKWIYDKIADYWKSNGSSIGSNFSALFHSAIDFGKTALTAAYNFVTGFANTVLTAGKGTIGAAILEIIGGSMNSAWEGAGDGLIEQATQWRKEAEGIWEASDFDTTMAVTKDWLDGDPLPADGETRSVEYVVSTTGEDITKAVNAIPGTTGTRGGNGPSGYWNPTTHEYSLHTADNSDITAKEWAKQMGEAGATFEQTYALLKEAGKNGIHVLPDVMETIMAEFNKGQEEYDAAHKTAAEEAAEVEIEAAHEEAAIETGAAEEAAATTTEAAKESAATEKAAAQELYRTLIGGSQAAANAIRIGSEIAANSVKIGLNSAGQEIAIIGQVAQRRFAEAGGILYDRVQVTGSGFSSAVGAAISGLQSKIQYAGAAIQTSAGSAGAALAAKIGAAASDFQLKGTYAGSSIQTAAGNAASKLSLGASDILAKSYNAGNALASGGSSAGSALAAGASAIRSAASSLGQYTGMKKYGDYYFASGGVTSGPQMAVIGEDGPANPEFIIPTKTKRWDLLLAAMKAYGIPGFAEGTTTGSATAGNGEPSGMTATFGITGLASMAKSVKKIITDIKDFFRISWGIVKAEGSTYWKQINAILTAEITTIRDSGWQAAIDIRNAWISTNAEIKSDATAFWAGYWASIEPSISSIKGNFVQSFTDIKTGIKDSIDGAVINSEASLQAFETSWSDIWTQLVTDMADAQTKVTEGVAVISEALKSISVNVNINANISSGGGGGGAYGNVSSSVVSGNSSGAMQFTDCLFEGFTDSCTGVLVNPLIYTNPQGVTSYINPMTYHSTGGISNYQGAGSSGNSGGSGSYQLPAIFRARGGLVEKPEIDVIADQGPEIILPTKLTRMFTSLAEMGFSAVGGRSSEKIVIEDHTEHHWYMDGKEVTNVLMDRVMKKMQLKGAVPAR